MSVGKLNAENSMKTDYSKYAVCTLFRRVSASLAVLAVISGWPLGTRAGTLSWSGDGGADANWSNSANWGYSGTPANGDTLVFPAGRPDLVNTNNLTSLIVAQIRFVGAGGGYAIWGNALTLTNGILATNTAGLNTINNSITLATINQPIIVSNNASLTMAGGLGGSVGVTKMGAGTLTYSGGGMNNYSGPTVVTGGTLELGKTITDGGIYLGSLAITNATVRETALYQLGSIPITIGMAGVLDLNGFYDTVGNSLTLADNGSVQTGAGGTLALQGSGTITTTGSSACAINGAGTLFLLGACGIVCNESFDVYASIAGTGPITKSGGASLGFHGANSYTGLTVVSSGIMWAYNSLSLGTPDSGTVVSNGATLALLGSFGITNEALFLNGAGYSTAWGALDIETSPGTNIWAGPITLNANSTLAPYYNDSVLHLPGAIGGAGGLICGPGTGIMYLDGTTNTYAGTTTINGGTLVANSYQPQSPVNVQPYARLGGSGTVGSITSAAYSIVAPGSSPGILTCSNVFLAANSTFSVELNGVSPGTGYDQLNVRGTNNISGCQLALSVGGGFSPVQDQPLVILNNDYVEAITGTFSGLPQGALISIGNLPFVISYTGGSGNDVTLTLTNQYLRSGPGYVSSGNGNAAIEANECNWLSLVVSNLSGSTMTGANATLRSLTPGVAVVQPFSSYPDIPAGKGSTNTVPFQISTLPGFVCGADVSLQLQLATATHGTLTVPFALPSGVAGSPVRFDVATATNIPDIGTIESTNTVVGFTGPLLKVAVSLWLTHTYDGDLNISLISPDGVVVDLSSGNGAGANFGSACSPDASRTTFDDAAVTAITAGVPPYVGSYRPEGSLASFARGTANGNWRLRVQDTMGGSLGALRCWSLLLYPTTCTPAGGACALCPQVTIESYTGYSTPLRPYLLANGVPSTCGVIKPCPSSDGTLFPGESFQFQNGPADACITVTGANNNIFGSIVVEAYLGIYDPAGSVCSNYLADAGTYINAATPSQSFSFAVQSNAVFTLSVVTDSGGLPYTLTVSGGDCRPALNLVPAGPSQVKLDWSTAAAGYQLECTNSLTPGSTAAWRAITNEPIVVSGRFTVTNAAPPPGNFYRLHKAAP